jgi:CubicO group peptidase (beta-lactamase class C family)
MGKFYDWKGVPDDTYFAAGFEGQFVVIIPSMDMVIVRLGQTAHPDDFDMGRFVGNIVGVLAPQ